MSLYISRYHWSLSYTAPLSTQPHSLHCLCLMKQSKSAFYSQSRASWNCAALLGNASQYHDCAFSSGQSLVIFHFPIIRLRMQCSPCILRYRGRWGSFAPDVLMTYLCYDASGLDVLQPLQSPVSQAAMLSPTMLWVLKCAFAKSPDDSSNLQRAIGRSQLVSSLHVSSRPT